MGIVTRAMAAPFKLLNLVRDEVSKDRRLRMSNGAGWAQFGGRESKAGVVVTQTSAMQVAAVWACIKITAQAVSSLPLALYEKGADGSRDRVDDTLAEVLCDSPNADQTALEYWEGTVAWLMTQGNAYSERRLNGRGDRLVALEPLPSDRVVPFRKDDGTLVYRISDRGKIEELPRDKVFHVKGFGQALGNMDLGMSAISAGTNSIGAAIAAQEAAAATYANGMRPSGFLTFENTLSPEQRKQARENIIAPIQGSQRAGAVGLLEAGVKWQSVSLNPEDAQLLETRAFDIEEICRWFGTPPVVIGHSSQGQTMWGSGVEQILLSWLTLGIDPICDRIEARIKKQLIRPTGNRRRYAEFNREALLQMDSKAKASFLSSMVQNGLMDRNEGRAKLNLPRREGGDRLTAQTNLAPLDQLGANEQGQQVRQAFRAWLSTGDDNE